MRKLVVAEENELKPNRPVLSHGSDGSGNTGTKKNCLTQNSIKL